MKKEEIYVVIDSEEKRLRALDILERAGEKVYETRDLLKVFERRMILSFDIKEWGEFGFKNTQITLDQLEQLLIPMSKLDQLKQQAEKLGYELVEKKREIKVDDFGVFWENQPNIVAFGFITKVEKNKKIDQITEKEENIFFDNTDTKCKNFRHLTEEEKQQIQNNW